MRRLIGQLLLALIVAGCVGNPNDGPITSVTMTLAPRTAEETSLPPTINGTADALHGLRPQLVDCDHLVASTTALRSDVEPHLPPEYPADGGTVVDVLLQALRCASFILNNETVIPSVTIATTVVRVAPNETLSGDAAVNYYVLELFFSNETVRNVFGALGYEAQLATMSLDDGAPLQFVVDVNGETWYTLRGANGVGDPFDLSYTFRYHYKTARGTLQFFDNLQTFSVPSQPGETMLEAGAGKLAGIWPGHQSAAPAKTQLGPASGELSFGGHP